jgi:hypothetical protein
VLEMVNIDNLKEKLKEIKQFKTTTKKKEEHFPKLQDMKKILNELLKISGNLMFDLGFNSNYLDYNDLVNKYTETKKMKLDAHLINLKNRIIKDLTFIINHLEG